MDTLRITPAFEQINALPYAQVRCGGTWPAILHDTIWQDVNTQYFQIPKNTPGWLRLVIHNSDSLDRYFESYLHSVTVNHSKLYVVTEDGVIRNITAQTGNLIPYDLRATPVRDFSLPFYLKAKQTATIYISVFQRGIHERVMLNLVDARFKEEGEWLTVAIIGILSVCFFISLIACIGVLFFRKKIYYLYALYIIFGSLFIAASYGFLAKMPGIKMLNLIENAPAGFSALTMASFIAFSNHLLKIKQRRKYCGKILTIIPYTGVLFFFAGLVYTLQLYPGFPYYTMAKVLAGLLVISLCVIFWEAYQKAFIEKERIFLWFFGVFGSLAILILLSLFLEIKAPNMPNDWVLITKTVLVLVELVAVMAFVVSYTLKQQQKVFCTEQEKEKQYRIFSNMLHTNIKGAMISVSHDIRSGVNQKKLQKQIENLIELCQLGELFLRNCHQNLYELLQDIDFWAKSILQNEAKETSFYAEIDASLQAIPVVKNDILNIFLRESILNIKHYSQYKHVKLSADLEHNQGDKVIHIEVQDDGIGLPQSLNLHSDQISLTEDNFQEFSQKHFAPSSTGIRRLFEAVRIDNDTSLEIHSSRERGTRFILFFRIQD